MRKAIALMMAGMLLFGAASAEFAVRFAPDEPAAALNLNGDGEIEEVRVQTIGEGEDAETMLVVMGGDGGVNTLTLPIYAGVTAGAADLDGDGRMEIYLTGEQSANDFATWCVQYSDEGLKTVPFPYYNRTEHAGGEAESGYGRITKIGGGEITLTGMQDILGTYTASRTLRIEDGRFVFADDGLYTVEMETEDGDLWEWYGLNPLITLNVKWADGSEGRLNAGERLLVTASDLVSVVHFRTEDGRIGSFEIEPNTESGWGCLIAGVPERDVFEYLPYSD